jgi:hypothetical protein
MPDGSSECELARISYAPVDDGIALVFECELVTCWAPTDDGGVVFRYGELESLADGLRKTAAVPPERWVRWPSQLTPRVRGVDATRHDVSLVGRALGGLQLRSSGASRPRQAWAASKLAQAERKGPPA